MNTPCGNRSEFLWPVHSRGSTFVAGVSLTAFLVVVRHLLAPLAGLRWCGGGWASGVLEAVLAISQIPGVDPRSRSAGFPTWVWACGV